MVAELLMVTIVAVGEVLPRDRSGCCWSAGKTCCVAAHSCYRCKHCCSLPVLLQAYVDIPTQVVLCLCMLEQCSTVICEPICCGYHAATLGPLCWRPHDQSDATISTCCSRGSRQLLSTLSFKPILTTRHHGSTACCSPHELR